MKIKRAAIKYLDCASCILGKLFDEGEIVFGKLEKLAIKAILLHELFKIVAHH